MAIIQSDHSALLLGADWRKQQEQSKKFQLKVVCIT